MLKDAPVAVTLPVVDLDRARRFYEQTLGLERVMDDDDATMYKAGQGGLLVLYLRGATKADHTALSFNVQDLDAEMKALRQKGIQFEEYDMPGLKTVNGVASVGMAKSAWFKDTEGNILAISELGQAA